MTPTPLSGPLGAGANKGNYNHVIPLASGVGIC
jgi:hypothetical protein